MESERGGVTVAAREDDVSRRWEQLTVWEQQTELYLMRQEQARLDAARRRQRIINFVVMVVLIGLTIYGFGTLAWTTTKPFFWWDLGILLAEAVVVVVMRNSRLSTLIVFLLLVLMFVPYFYEVSQLPSVQTIQPCI